MGNHPPRAVWRRHILLSFLVVLAAAGGDLAPTRAQSGPPSRIVQARPAGAFITLNNEEQTWTIGNAAIEATFGVNSSRELVLTGIASPQTGRLLTVSAAPDTTVTINGVATSLGSTAAGWTLDGVDGVDAGNGRQLVFSFSSSRLGVLVRRSYACVDGSPTIEAWTTISATGRSPVTVSPSNLWQITIPSSVVHYANGLRGDVAGAQVDDAFTLHSTELGASEQLVLQEGNRSTEQYLPMIAADLDQSEFYGGLEWSGAWRISMQRTGSTLRVSAGVPGTTVTVDPGASLGLPHGFFGFTPGDRADVAGALRDFLVQGIRGGRPLQPMVTDNTWFSYGTDIDEASVMNEMAGAAGAGVELFVLDAGWYLGARGGGDFESGLGTWEADPARFPSGLAALRDYAHELGMQFGLWVEPERVNLSTVGRPGLAQQAWLATNNGSTRSSTTAQLCFGSAAARQWIVSRLTRLIDEVQPDYLKWDNNFWINCNRSGHGHGTTDGNFAHVNGLYAVLDELRQRYPSMLIENCSQGGNRADFGMLRYTDTAWMDDRTTPSIHVRHNLEGLSTFFPPSYLLSFEVDDSDEPIAGASDLSLYLRSRMLGILGLTYRAADLTEDDRSALNRDIDLYKQLRETQRDAMAVLLTAQAADGGGPTWDAVQEVSKSGDSIVFAFQNDGGTPAVTVALHGLEANTTYSVTSVDGEPLGFASGAELMTDGLAIVESPETAAHVLLVRATRFQPAASGLRPRQ